MAPINQTQFVNFLNSCKIDLNTFKDLSFDGICEEKSLQHFLSWIINSFDGDNVAENNITSNGYINSTLQNNPAQFGDSYDELFENIDQSLSIKLKESEKLKKKFVELDNKLRLKEKTVYEDIFKAEKDLAAAIADCQVKQVEDECEMVYKLILNNNPYSPNIDSYNEKAGNLCTNIHDLYKSSIDKIEEKFEEECRSYEPPMADFEDFAFKIQLENYLANKELDATNQWLNNLKTPVDFEYLLFPSNWIIPEYKTNSNEMNKIVNNAKDFTKGKALERKTAIKKRKHSVNLYMKNQLIENNKLLHSCFIYSSLAQSFINVRSNKIEKLSTLVDDFFSSISKRYEGTLSIVNTCDSNCSAHDIPLLRGISTVNSEVIGICHELLQSLRNEFRKNQAFRENVNKSLQYFRNGPTLRFNYLPMDLIIQFDNCRNLHEKVVKDVSQNARFYCNVKNNVRGDHDRIQQLMWVFFLTDPSKLESIQLDYSSFNITFRN